MPGGLLYYLHSVTRGQCSLAVSVLFFGGLSPFSQFLTQENQTTPHMRLAGASAISKCSFRLYTRNLVKFAVLLSSYKKEISITQLESCGDVDIFISKSNYEKDIFDRIPLS